MKLRSSFYLVILTVLTAGLISQAKGQAVTATMLGTISDQSGAVIPNAHVTITEEKTGVSYKRDTNGSGNYEFPNLAPGVYDVNVEQAGFESAKSLAINVSVNSSVRVNLSLTVGVASQQVVVTAQGALLQTDRADVTQSLDSRQVTDLPNVGESQNFQSLTELIPGVSAAFHDQGPAFDAQESEGFEVNGQSEFANNLQFEGIDDNERTGLLQVYLPAAQAIQTVNVSTSNYAPEFGRAGGAVTNVTLKSGTNDFHGSLFEYNELSTLQAKSYFDTTTPKPTLTNNYYGFTLGGPIVKNHTFFFADLLRYDNHNGNFNLVTVPTAAFRAGDLTASTTKIYDPATGNSNGTGRQQISYNGTPNVIAPNRISPIAESILALIPLPNVPGAGFTNNYSNVTGFAKDSTQFDVKVDQNLRAADRLTYRYSMQKVVTNVDPLFGMAGGDTGSGLEGTGSQKSYNTALEYIRVVSPSLVMELRGGIDHYRNVNRQSDYGSDASTQLGIPGVNQSPFTSGLVAISLGTSYANPLVGYGADIPWDRGESNIDLVDNWTKMLGNHTIKFGGEVRRIRDDLTQGNTFGPRGIFTYADGQTALNGGGKTSFANNFASFLLDVPSSVGRDVNVGDASWRQTLYFGFIQDSWQATQKLTLMYGLRWELYPPSTPSATGGFSQYDPSSNSLEVAGYGSIPKDLGVQTNYKDFGPRFGFAYRVTNTTVIRGGFGTSYEPFPDNQYAYNQPVRQNQAFNSLNSYTPALLPNGQPSSLAAGFPVPAQVTIPPTGIIANAPASQVYTVVNTHYRDPYVMSYNLTAEQQFAHGFVFDLAYVGNEGREIPAGYNLNSGFIAGAGAAGQPEYATHGRTAATNLLAIGTSSNYNSLQARLNRRFENGFSLVTSYTYQKAMGFVSSAGSLGYYSFYIDPQRNYSRLAWDQTHSFRQGALYELPFGKGRPFLESGLLGKVVGGIQVGTVLSINSGLPMTFTASAATLNAPGTIEVANETGPFVKTKGIGTGKTWFNTSAFSQPVGLVNGNTGQNIYSGPNQFELDGSLRKRIPITERVGFELRMNAFNATNTPVFKNPDTSTTDSSFGEVTKGGTSSRVIQLAGTLTF
jgi:Carboxypeptidase regulatory-like domain